MRKLAWLGLAAVVVVALVIGTTDRSPQTKAQRVRSLGNTIMCPACSGESVTNSQAPIAVYIRGQIKQRVDDGQTDQEIRDALANAYGDQILMNPPKSGIAGLVWVLPVAALVVALAGLFVAFRRWRALPAELTDEDREAAERARREQGDEA
jgi:cytochrome c-type biogenesis protein CcmH